MHESQLTEDLGIDFGRRRLEKRSEIDFGRDAALLDERQRIRVRSGRHIVPADDRYRVELAQGLMQRRRLVRLFF